MRTVVGKLTSRPFLKETAKLINESTEAADAVGRSLVVEKDRLSSDQAKFQPQNVFIAQDKPVRIAFDLIPKEALDYIRYKAFAIAGIEHGKLLAAVKEKIEAAVRDGKRLDEFKAEVNELFDSYGVTRLSSRHLDTIFRTNIFTAYSIGQLDQVGQMTDRFPLWRYSAILDSRTRPDHAELNGNIYRTGEGPIPPIDYNCRCTAIYLHISQIERDHLWSQVRGWSGGEAGFGDPNVRFTTRASFEAWKGRNQEAISPEVEAWIRENL